jgi:hypothetical protein
MYSRLTQPRKKRNKRKKEFLNWRLGLTQMTAWRIEVAPVPGLSNVATPTKAIITIPSLYMDVGIVMMPKKGVPSHV